MGLLSWLFGRKGTTAPKGREKSAEELEYERRLAIEATQKVRREAQLNPQVSAASVVGSSSPARRPLPRRDVFASHDQSKEWVKNVRDVNRRVRASSVRRAQVYTYTWKGLPALRTGQRITMRRSSATSLKSTYNGSTWEKNKDGGTAFSYKGKTCCVVFSSIVEGHDSVTMVCEGQFSRGLPELRVEVQQHYEQQDEARYVPRNRRPSRLPELKATRTVALSGEEDTQDILTHYGNDALVWLTVRRGEIPKGKSKGQPTLWFSLDGIDVGYLTALQGERHYDQIPDTGAMCLARIKQGAKKYEVTVHLPDYKKKH